MHIIPYADKTYDELAKQEEAVIVLSIYDDLSHFDRLRVQTNIS